MNRLFPLLAFILLLAAPTLAQDFKGSLLQPDADASPSSTPIEVASKDDAFIKHLVATTYTSPAWVQVSSPYARRFFGSTLPAACSPYQTQVDSATGLLNICPTLNTWKAIGYGGVTLPATATQGDVLYASAANTFSTLAKSTSATRYLSNTGTSNNPAWAQIDLTNGVTGALLAVNGGTGNSTYTKGDLLVGRTTPNNLIILGVGTDGQVLTADAAQALGVKWATVSAGITNSAGANVVPKSNGTNLVASPITADGTDVQVDVSSGGGGIVFTADSSTSLSVLGSNSGPLITLASSTESFLINGSSHTITAMAAAGFKASGTATNDDAAAGLIGEYKTASLASGSATSLSTGTAKTIISISLTAGDWDVYGIVDYVPAATTTTSFVQQGASATDNTLGGEGTFTSSSGGNLSGTVLGSLIAENVPYQRISLSGTTTIYLVGKASFAISTMTAYGSIFARRAR